MKRSQKFLAYSVISIIAVTFTFSCSPSKTSNQPKAKYVFYFIGDGLGFQHITSTQAFIAANSNQNGEIPLTFTQFPITGVSATYAHNRYITGSAAAGTALATGSKTSIGTLALSSDHTDTLQSIAYHAHKAGYQVGITTCVSIDHATPAAFYAHQKKREFYHRISHDMLNAGYKFFAGGGFKDPEGKDSETPMGNVFDIGASQGVFFTQNLAIPDSIQENYKSIVYTDPNPTPDATLQYKIDNNNSYVTLADVTSLAIDILENPQGFFLMVEGGKIDWASHHNDAATTIYEIIAFSEAIDVAFEFYKNHPDETLIIVTSDHETGGMSFGNRYYGYESDISMLASQKFSLDEFNNIVLQFKEEKGNSISFDNVLTLLSNELDLGTDKIQLSKNQMEQLKRAYNLSIASKTSSLAKQISIEYGSFDPIAYTAIQVLNQKAGIGWTTNAHTGSHVPVFAIGVGEQHFSGYMDNTDIPKRIAKIMSLDF